MLTVHHRTNFFFLVRDALKESEISLQISFLYFGSDITKTRIFRSFMSFYFILFFVRLFGALRNIQR